MAESDEINERLIEDFTPRLKELIGVQQVLDYLHIIDNDQKERIKQKLTNEGNRAAAELLIAAVLKKPHPLGWFRAFVDALENSGCEFAADYIQVKLPDPEVEAENDYCVKLVQLMCPELVDMKTDQVCICCFSQDLLIQADVEIVSTVC